MQLDEKSFKNNTFSPEKYPIVIQVVGIYLTAYAPDFDYRVAEPYRPNDVGQTEMLIIKIRREIQAKLKQLTSNQKEHPAPSKSKTALDIENEDTLSTLEVARLLRVSDETVRRFAKAGKLEFQSTLGGHRRFLRSTIERFIAAQLANTVTIPGNFLPKSDQ